MKHADELSVQPSPRLSVRRFIYFQHRAPFFMDCTIAQSKRKLVCFFTLLALRWESEVLSIIDDVRWATPGSSRQRQHLFLSAWTESDDTCILAWTQNAVTLVLAVLTDESSKLHWCAKTRKKLFCLVLYTRDYSVYQAMQLSFCRSKDSKIPRPG